MEDDFMMKEKSRMSARGKEGEQRDQMKMKGNSLANDSIFSKEFSLNFPLTLMMPRMLNDEINFFSK